MSFLRSLASTSRLFPARTQAFSTSPITLIPKVDLNLLDIPGAPESSTSSPPANGSTASRPNANAGSYRSDAYLPTEDPILVNDSWWKSGRRSIGSPLAIRNVPGNQYSGRSIEVRNATDVAGAFKRLAVRLGRSGLRADVRRSEYHEKPSEKKRRLASVRHRRRFQEMVREKVQTVQMIRNRG